MKYAHLIKLTVFSHENENSQNILEAFLRFFPFNLEDNKILLKKSNAEGFNDKKIGIFEVILTKDNLINQFLESLLSDLGKNQKDQLLSQSESRLDKNLDFFIRFDKNLLINDKKLELTDSGKCFHLKISIAAFPKKREVALNVIKELLSQ
ncbi:MAG: RNA-binding domain-containing protein [Nanoarchaeota archaeon]